MSISHLFFFLTFFLLVIFINIFPPLLGRDFKTKSILNSLKVMQTNTFTTSWTVECISSMYHPYTFTHNGMLIILITSKLIFSHVPFLLGSIAFVTFMLCSIFFSVLPMPFRQRPEGIHLWF